VSEKLRRAAGVAATALIGFLPFLFLFIWHGRVASSYDAGAYYGRVLPWLIACVLVVLAFTAWKRTGLRGKLLLWIPAWLLCFGVAAQAVWMRYWVMYVEAHPQLQEKHTNPASRQGTTIVLVSLLLGLLAACCLAYLNQKKVLNLQHRPKILLLFIGVSMLGAWLPAFLPAGLEKYKVLYEINKITFVMGLSILLTWPIFDRDERLGKLSLAINRLFGKIPVLRLLSGEEGENGNDPLKLVCCTLYTAWFALPLLMMGETEFGSMIIMGITFLVMILTYLESAKKVALVSAVVLPLLGLGAFLIARGKIARRFDIWWNFKAQGADNQQYLSMRAVLLGGWFGSDRRYFSYIPVGDSDMIGAVSIQCFGLLLGGILLMALCLVFIWLGFRAALGEKDHLQRGMAFGFSTTIGVQSLLMWAGNLVLLPLSGNTQPFMSSGGGALMSMFFMACILYLLNRRAHQQETAAWGEIT